MQTTQNYGYNMVESADNANIPVQISPNFSKIDNDLKAVSDAAITSAVDTFASNTHALVRDDADRNAIFFIAPADYVAGDVFTLDGVNMNTTDAAGNALESNAFRVNSVVFGIVYGTRLTLNVVNPVSVPPTPDASDIDYDNTASGLTADDVQGAIDEIENQLNNLPAPTAGNISYNNSVSGLVATNVQQAIDELKNMIPAHQYITTGLSIEANRCNIISGGYYIENGYVNVDITVILNGNYTVNTTLIVGFPQAAGVGDLTQVFNKLMMRRITSPEFTYLGAGTSVSAGETLHFIGSYLMA